MQFIEFKQQDPLYDVVMTLRYQTFFEPFGLPKSITPDELEPVSTHVALLSGATILAYGRLSCLQAGAYRLSQILVPLAHRRQGYASLLIKDLLVRAKALGAKQVELNAQVSAQALYEQFGFVVKGEPYEVTLTGVQHVKMAAVIS